MGECSICGEYDEDLHPVDFEADPEDPECPEEIKKYLGLGDYLDDTDANEAADDFWENCARICGECFRKYGQFIVWWGWFIVWWG